MPAIGEAVGNGTVSPCGALNFKLKMKVDTSRGIGGKAVGLLSMVNGTAGKTASRGSGHRPARSQSPEPHPIPSSQPDVSGLMKNNSQQFTNTLTGLLGGKKK